MGCPDHLAQDEFASGTLAGTRLSYKLLTTEHMHTQTDLLCVPCRQEQPNAKCVLLGTGRMSLAGMELLLEHHALIT